MGDGAYPFEQAPAEPSDQGQIVGIGIDVGADRVHLVALDASFRVVTTAVMEPGRFEFFESILRSCKGSIAVAIDGPDGPSMAPFRNDPTVSGKFRNARGCEVELGRQRKIWVSFATGPEPLSGWALVASDLFSLTRSFGHRPLETYPYAIFHTLAGRRLPKKTTGAGITARVGTLQSAGLQADWLAMWSHDALDAAAAALVAVHHFRNTAIAIACPLDDTTIWLPPTTT